MTLLVRRLQLGAPMSYLPTPKNGFYFTLDELEGVTDHINHWLAESPGTVNAYGKIRREAIKRLLRRDRERRGQPPLEPRPLDD